MKKIKGFKFLTLVFGIVFALTMTSIASAKSRGGNDNMIVNINGGVVEIISGESSEPTYEYDNTLCTVVSETVGNSTTITITSLKTTNSWAGKVCKIFLPTSIDTLSINTQTNSVTSVSNFNVDMNVTDNGFTTITLPLDYAADVNVVTTGVTQVTIPKNIDNATFTSTNKGVGIVTLPFCDYFFLNKNYQKVFGNGEQIYKFEAQERALLTVLLSD